MARRKGGAKELKLVSRMARMFLILVAQTVELVHTCFHLRSCRYSLSYGTSRRVKGTRSVRVLSGGARHVVIAHS